MSYELSAIERKRIDLDRERGKRSLLSFVGMAWSEVVPDRFVNNWHLGAMCEALQALYAREIRELVIAVPPGFTKSLLVSTLGPAWRWIIEPSERFIGTTYEQSLGEKNARLHRDLVAGEWFQRRWGDKVALSSHDDKKVRLFANRSKGWRFTTSVGGAVLGRHADCLMADDLVKVQDADNLEAHQKAKDFWFEVIPTRQANPRSTIKVVIAQRLHKADVVGECINRGYTTLSLPMRYKAEKKCVIPQLHIEDPRTTEGELLCPERLPAEDEEKLRKDLGPLVSACQLDQNPTPPDGTVFSRAWFDRRYLPGTAPVYGRMLFVDCAFKDLETSDEVSIRVGARAGSTLYAIDEHTERLDLNGTVAACKAMIEKHKARGVYVEDKANGPEVIKALRREFPFIVEWQPRSSKEARAMACQPTFKAGSVLFPPLEECQGWWLDLVQQCMDFPKGAHDDRVDSLVMLIDVLADKVDYAAKLRAMVEQMKRANMAHSQSEQAKA